MVNCSKQSGPHKVTNKSKMETVGGGQETPREADQQAGAALAPTPGRSSTAHQERAARAVSGEAMPQGSQAWCLRQRRGLTAHLLCHACTLMNTRP